MTSLDQIAVSIASICESNAMTNKVHAEYLMRLADKNEKETDRVAKFVDATQMKILKFGASKVMTAKMHRCADSYSLCGCVMTRTTDRPQSVHICELRRRGANTLAATIR